jgi:dinuclear metal center YbgI/SA1388 family protein
MKRTDLVKYLDSYLKVNEIKDYGPQGLQVESANEEIQRLALAVDTSPATIKAAASWQADMMLVHHGILWGSGEAIRGPLGKRVRLLLESGINLYACHLPLDAHPEVGNNAVLAQMMDVTVTEWWCAPKGTPIGVFGSVAGAPSLADFVARLEDRLNTNCRLMPSGPDRVQFVAIVSGFGADETAGAEALGADTFLTGETSHANYWAASDYGLNVIYAGHYATETVGVKALGRHLSTKFDLETRFLDFPTAM